MPSGAPGSAALAAMALSASLPCPGARRLLDANTFRIYIVHMENEHEICIISFRKATKRESQIYFDAIQD